jgi:hypothetical protein
MITVTLKYTDYGHQETQEFREYTKNLVGHRDTGEYRIKFGIESDPMFDNKVVCQIEIEDEDYAFDVVNHYMIDREVNGDNVPFDVDLSSVAVYVTGSDRISNYMISRSFSHLYEKMEITESVLSKLNEKCSVLESNQQKISAYMENIGADKFPDIVKKLIDSMEAEGHNCKTEINAILQRKIH